MTKAREIALDLVEWQMATRKFLTAHDGRKAPVIPADVLERAIIAADATFAAEGERLVGEVSAKVPQGGVRNREWASPKWPNRRGKPVTAEEMAGKITSKLIRENSQGSKIYEAVLSVLKGGGA